MSIDLTGKNKFAWFVLHAETESGVVCMHIYDAKMAETSRDIENALNKIVSTTHQSRNMRKELNKTIYETVSTLRNIRHKLRGMLDEKTQQTKQMENEVNTIKSELEARTNSTAMGRAETSSAQKRTLPRTGSRQVLPPPDRNRKLLQGSCWLRRQEIQIDAYIKS